MTDSTVDGASAIQDVRYENINAIAVAAYWASTDGGRSASERS